jgi:hypothetical protein
VHPGAHASVSDVYNGWINALHRIGCDVHGYNLHDRIMFYEHAIMVNDQGEIAKQLDFEQAIRAAAFGVLSSAMVYWPDVVLVITGIFVPSDFLEVLRARRMKVVIIHTEQPYELDRELRAATAADLNLINDPLHLDKFRELGPPAYYQHHCYDPEIHHSGRSDYKADVSFIGTGFDSRIEFMEAVPWGDLDVMLAGNWIRLGDESPLRPYLFRPADAAEYDEGDTRVNLVDNQLTADIYRGSKSTFNLYRREGVGEGNVPIAIEHGVAMGPREVEAPMCGTLLLRQSRPEGDELLPMLPRFETPEELGEAAQWWAAHDDARQKVIDQSREVLADWTFENAARDLLRRLEAL